MLNILYGFKKCIVKLTLADRYYFPCLRDGNKLKRKKEETELEVMTNILVRKWTA